MASTQIFTTIQLGLNTGTAYHHIQTVWHSDGGSQNYGVGTTSEFNAKLRMPTAGTLRNLRIDLQDGSSVGAGESWTFTVRKNETDQSLAVVLSEGETSETDTSNTVSFSAGDQISVSVAPTGSPAGNIFFSMNLEAEYSGSDNYSVISGGFQDTTVNQYSPVGIYMSSNSTSADTDKLSSIPFPATLRAFYGDLSSAPGASGTRRIDLSTGQNVSFGNNDTEASSTGLAVDLTEGGTWRATSVEIGNVTAAYVRYSLLLESDEGYENYSWLPGMYDVPSGTEYGGFSGVVGVGSEYKHYVGPTGFTLRNLYINCDVVDANGNQTVTVRKNGSDTSLSASTGSLSDSGSDVSNSVSVVEGDYVGASYSQTGDNEPGNYNLAMVVEESSSRRIFNIT